MSFTFDSNILIYALDNGAGVKRERARALIDAALQADAILTAQALGEFLNVFRTKKSEQYPIARMQADRFVALFAVVPTRAQDMLRGVDFARKHNLRLWDSVIWQVAAAAGATILISEDMRDGLTLDGMMVVNPFNNTNDELIRLLFAAHPEEE